MEGGVGLAGGLRSNQLKISYRILRQFWNKLWSSSLKAKVTLTYACFEYQLSSLFTLVFAVLSAVVLVSGYLILERTFGLGSSSEGLSEVWEFLFVCLHFCFLPLRGGIGGIS